MTSLIEQDHYGNTADAPITPPNVQAIRFARAQQDSILVEFDQPVQWRETLTSEFYLDGESGKVASGFAQGNTLMLQLFGPSTAKTLTYLDSQRWSQKRLLRGANGIAALTFCEVPILRPEPTQLR